MAGEPAADEIDRKEVCASGLADIGHGPIGVGEVLCENGAREGLALDLPDGARGNARLRERGEKAKFKAADTRKQGADADHAASSPNLAANFFATHDIGIPRAMAICSRRALSAPTSTGSGRMPRSCRARRFAASTSFQSISC